MPNLIGQALIEVVAAGNNFEKSITTETQTGLHSAEVAAAESGTKMGSGLKGKFSSAFSGVGQIAKIAIGVGVAEAFKTGFEHVAAVQTQMSAIEAGLKSTGDQAGITAPQMEDLAKNVQGYSGQSEEATLRTEQLLLSFTNIRNEAGKNNDIFTQTTKVAADMSQRLGVGTSSAARILGKALNDPIKGLTALTRVGVQFTDGQKTQIQSMVASGNVMGAQKIILDQLNTKFGGTAEAYGKTLPGQIAIAKASFTDIAGNIVTSMMPAFNAIIAVIQVLLPILAAVAPILGPLAIGILAVVGAIKAWTAIQEALDAVLEANPIVLIVTALALLAVGLIAAYKHSETFRNVVHDAFHVVEVAASAVSDAIKVMGEFFKTVIGDVVNFVHDHWMLILGILTGPIGLAVAFIVSHWNQISSTVSKVVGDVIGFFQNLVSFVASLPGKIGSAASGMWDGIKEAFRGAIDWIIRGWNSLHFRIPGFKVGPIHFGGFDLGLPQIPELATGGYFKGLAIAGEFGPELIAGSGTVLSRSDTARALHGSGVTIEKGAIQVVIQGHADTDVMHTAANEMLDRLALTLRGRGVQVG